MAKSKKPKRTKKRQGVRRAERHPATPETLKKLQRDALADLQVRDDGGLHREEVDALVEIENAFHIIEGIIGNGGPTWIGDRAGSGGAPEISDAAARWWAIWNIWATEFYRRHKIMGIAVAVLVERRQPVGAGDLITLRQAANLWERTRRDYDAARRVERNQRHTIAPSLADMVRRP